MNSYIWNDYSHTKNQVESENSVQQLFASCLNILNMMVVLH